MNINNANTVEDFSDVLRGLMHEKKLSYNQLAYKCKLSPQFLHQIATKKVLPPKDKFIKAIAKSLNIEPEYFFEYRLRRLISFLSNNREYLDLFVKEVELSQKKRKAQRARVRAKKLAEAEEISSSKEARR